MTTFNPDPRVRDREPNTTALGPNFPGSLNDLWRMVFRPSDAFLRYVALAIVNDDGSLVGENVEEAVQALQTAAIAELAAVKALLETGIVIDRGNKALRVTSATFRTDVVMPPGVGAAVAYADLDAMGTSFGITVPNSGIIQSAICYDRSDQNIGMDLWLFESDIAAETDNDPFSLTDADLQRGLNVIQFTAFRDAANGRIATQDAIGFAYKLPGTSDRIYAQVQARGVTTITAGAVPTFALTILAD